MSTNPKTKAYAKRIKRMAQELSFYAGYGLSPLQETADRRDPNMPEKMLLQAIDEGIEASASRIEMFQREIERARAGVVALEKFRDETKRWTPVVLDGGKAGDQLPRGPLHAVNDDDLPPGPEAA